MLSVAECERIARVVCDVPVTAVAPDVSVVIPVHNEPERLLRRCTESLLAQTFTGEIEALLVDDASTDDALARCEAIAREYNEKADAASSDKLRVRVRVFSLRENSGSAAVPRNIGVAYARGKYISFLDSDDYMIERTYETLFRIAEEDRLDLILFGCTVDVVNVADGKHEIVSTTDHPLGEDVVALGVTDLAGIGYNILGKVTGGVTEKFFARTMFTENPELEFPHLRYLDDTVVGQLSVPFANRVRYIADCLGRKTGDGGRKFYHLILAESFSTWLEIKTRLERSGRLTHEVERLMDNLQLKRTATDLRNTTDSDIVVYILNKIKTVFLPNTFLTTAPQREFVEASLRDMIRLWRKITPERFCELNGIVWKGMPEEELLSVWDLKA
ncbi:hypothetical protein FACS1894133_1050 [Clostridia bacterium]|nr:hypothetical protein FACS1894133_1050 [Clostridia bacterium]